MEVTDKLKRILGDTLQLGARAQALTASSRLMGEIPEFDSMAVVSVLTMVEEQFGITIDDDELTAEVFETFGSLADFVAGKVAR